MSSAAGNGRAGPRGWLGRLAVPGKNPGTSRRLRTAQDVEPSLRARVRAGDSDAFGVLFDECARAVYNLAFRMTGNWSAAEEVVSTDLRTLLNMIYAATKGAGQSPDQEAFTTIGDMLREAVAPPYISAALYRAAALIPGVRVVPHVTDILGRSGIGVQFARKVIQSPAPGVPYRETYDPNGPIWIFHPRSLLWMGENDGSLHGKAMGEVVLKRAIVDRLGQPPHGH